MATSWISDSLIDQMFGGSIPRKMRYTGTDTTLTDVIVLGGRKATPNPLKQFLSTDNETGDRAQWIQSEAVK
jgi:hypothetical protein